MKSVPALRSSWLQRWRDHGVCGVKPRGGNRALFGRLCRAHPCSQQPDRTLDELVAAMRKRRLPGSRARPYVARVGVGRFWLLALYVDPSSQLDRASRRDATRSTNALPRFLMRVFMPIIPMMNSALLYRRNSEQGTLRAVERHVAAPIPLETGPQIRTTAAQLAESQRHRWGHRLLLCHNVIKGGVCCGTG